MDRNIMPQIESRAILFAVPHKGAIFPQKKAVFGLVYENLTCIIHNLKNILWIHKQRHASPRT